MATISALCTSRSTSETTQAAFGKTSFHSPNGRLVVISVLLFLAGCEFQAPHDTQIPRKPRTREN
jgi:hypothetical protein